MMPGITMRADYHATVAAMKLVGGAVTRLQIVDMLGDGSLHVGAIRDRLGGIPRPSVSHHLARLRAGRLVEKTSRGRRAYYALTPLGRGFAAALPTLAGAAAS